jgi:hypothetical protein
MTNTDLYEILIFLLGVMVGSVITLLWTSARTHWQRATGQLRAHEKARQQAKEHVQSARVQTAQGWRELRNALWQLLLLLVFLVICFYVLTNFLAGGT